VTWWDVEAGETRTATLPAETIEVLPAPGTSTDAAAPRPAAAPAEREPATPPAARPDREMPIVWLAGAGLLTIMLAAGVGIVVRRRRVRTDDDVPATAPSTHELIVDVENACRRDDARAARAAILRWGHGAWVDTPPASTSQIARRFGDPELAEALAALDLTLYGRDPEAWRGEGLWRAFRAATRGRRARDGGVTPDLLPPLYPRDRAA
jgi:hypothetical protein